MKKMILTPNPYRDKGFRSALAAEKILQQSGVQTRLCLPFNVDRSFELPSHMKFCDLAKELPGADMMVCFGGDGTILHLSKQATLNHVPILSVNVGNMGFMAELEARELELLKKAAAGEYTIDERMMLSVSVRRGNEVTYEDLALNDAVITKGAVARVLQVSVCCEDEEIANVSGDGVIFSTPTGSTAYSMSAGGPVVEPQAQNLLVTPICAHALVSRCIVLRADRRLTARVGKTGKRAAYLSVDGGRAIRLDSGDVVQVERANCMTQLVRVKNTSFFEILNSKFKNK